MAARFFFPPPEPVREKHSIVPIFLPFSGCPHRCVFCAQDVQTGIAENTIAHALERAEKKLDGLLRNQPFYSPDCEKARSGEKQPRNGRSNKVQKPELAFFGGTFTALAEADLQACLDFASRWREKGLVGDLRCSTRPDALSPATLVRLREAGFTCVELGIQSFSAEALLCSKRGYSPEQARRACGMVNETGLGLGIQLLPGMPGHSPEAARADVEASICLGPHCVRLYPCLVIAGTGLERMWRAGRYTPWDLAATVDFLAWAYGRFRQAGITVIRMGLAEEPGLAEQTLAGPRHPAIGGMARARDLYAYIRGNMLAMTAGNALPAAKRQAMLLLVPRRYQGAFWGHGRELAAAYAALGLAKDNVRWWDEDAFALEYKESSPAGDAWRPNAHSEQFRRCLPHDQD